MAPLSSPRMLRTLALPFTLLALACGSEGTGPGGYEGTFGPAPQGSAGEAGSAGSAGASSVTEGPPNVAGLAGAAAINLNPTPGPFTWAGVIGTGQSLAVGTTPVNTAVNQQPYNNLMLSLGGAGVPPFDPNAAALSIVPLQEPLRNQSSGFPRAYPGNLWGETPHGAMAAQVSALAAEAPGGDYVTVHSVVGESGQGMVAIKKGAVETTMNGGIIGRAYAASMFEVAAIARLASEQGQTYGVGAIVVTHGETDSGSSSYEAELVQLWSDYNADIAAITGQTQMIPMIVSQHHAYGFTAGARSGASASTLTQWRIGVNNPGEIICSGPKYQYPYVADGIHLDVRGYEMLGEKYGQIYYQKVVLGADWQPLQPTSVERDGTIVRVHFQVPVPPLAWDDVIPAPHQSGLTPWAQGRGFELRAGGTDIEILLTEIVGDTVELTTASPVPANTTVGYAVTSDGTAVLGLGHRWGQLRDSDPFVGKVTGAPQPNYAVAFEMPLP